MLDVAGGPGEPSLTIAEIVGTRGHVTCTDAVVEMVDAARAEADRRALKNVEFRQCTADSLPFLNNSFDVVVSRLGAMFFPDPLLAVGEMLRVTRPLGSLSLAVWHKGELNPFCSVVTEIMSRYVEIPASDADAPGAFRFAEPGKLADIVKDAGAIDVGERILKFQIEAPISPEEFWTMRSETSETLREQLASLSAAQAAQVSRNYREMCSSFFPEIR